MADSTPATGGRDGHDAPGPNDTHDTHDPELIAALLDRDLPDADRAAAQALVTNCPSCAALHVDLIALTQATVEVPTPARPRDFTMTPAIAATLARQTSGEPVPDGARLSREMPISRSRHEAHDRLLIANLIDRSVDEAERARAEELLAACRECEQLYDDLVALSAATRAMAAPARQREFTLTTADAERLRVRGWRRLLSAIGSSRDVFSRPLAVGLTTLGVAGILVATIPAALTGLGGSATGLTAPGQAVDDAAGGAAANPEMVFQASEAPAADSGPAAVAAAPSAAAPSAAAEAAPAPSGDTGTERLDDGQLFFGSETSPLPGEPDGTDMFASNRSVEGPFTSSTMIAVASLLLVVGLGLFALRWTARRLGDG